MSTATVETREAAWLSTTTDSLPVLIAPGGPWEVLQAFDPVAHRRTQETTILVIAARVSDQRVSNQRIRPQYEITLDVTWPVRNPAPPIAEGEMQRLKNAVDLVLQRIRGPVGDKTHGGRFLSVAEVPAMATVTYADAAATIPAGKYVACTISYKIDDLEING